jgi:hypothetical protein
MIDIVLHNNHDAIFMMAMIFIHDFLHDFGNLSGRITSIKSEIQEFRTFISDMAPMTEKKKGGGPTEFFEDEILDTVTSGSGITLQTWIEFLKSGGVSTIFPEEDTTNIQFLIETYEFILTGRTTRSRTRAIQIVQDFIYETKLYVYGLIYSEESQTGGMDGPTLTMNRPALQHKFEPKEKVLFKPMKKEFSLHCEYLRVAFDKAIYKFSHDDELVRYFKFMKTLYLYYEDESKNPYTIFNNIHIENALILYLLDTKNVAIKDSNIHFILESLQLQYMLRFNKDKIKGGGPQDIQTYIEESFADIFFVILEAGTIESIYSDYDSVTANDSLKQKIQTLIERVNSDTDTLNILNRKNYDMHIGSIESKYANYKIMVGRGDRKTVIAKKDFVSACINLLKYIYNTVIQHIESLNAKINAEISKSASKSLSAEQKEGPQMILVTVAKGGKEYILANLDKTHPDYNTALETECGIVDLVSSSKKFTSDTIDDKIKDAFITYAKKFQPDKILKSLTAIGEVIKEKKKRLNVIAINNAATDALNDVGIDKDKHICPTSSVCDAQGSFGSCPANKLPKKTNREFYPMDFKIKNRDESIFYHGRTELRNKGKITEVKITFSSEVNDFFLPEVQIDIDITEKHAINVLGANESYKELLNTIVSIWARIFKKKPRYELSPNMLWEALQRDTVFIEFVSAGAVKSVGDLFQEVNSVAQFSGYDSRRITQKNELKNLTNKINGEFRVGANGDRPSGVRAGYILLKSISGINDKAMAGYFYDEKSFAIRSDIPTVFSEVAPRSTKLASEPEESQEEENLNKLTVEKIKELLTTKRISFKGKTKKADLLELLSENKGGSRKLKNRVNNKTRKYMKIPL